MEYFNRYDSFIEFEIADFVVQSIQDLDIIYQCCEGVAEHYPGLLPVYLPNKSEPDGN